MMYFETAFKYVIVNEGEQGNAVKADKGGYTKWGITESSAKNHRCLRHPVGINVKLVDLELAKHIYISDYWNYDAINDVRIAVKLFDYSVNYGPKTAVLLVQRALRALGDTLRADGIFGRITANALNAIDPIIFLDAFETVGDDLYADIVIEDFIEKYGKAAFEERQLKFLKGWLRRSNKRYYP